MSVVVKSDKTDKIATLIFMHKNKIYKVRRTIKIYEDKN